MPRTSATFPSSGRLPHTTGWDHNALMFMISMEGRTKSERQFILPTTRGPDVPSFTFASAVKYKVDIELLVLLSILALLTVPTRGLARRGPHAPGPDDDATLLVQLLGGLFRFFFASTAKYTIDIELFLLHAIVGTPMVTALVKP